MSQKRPAASGSLRDMKAKVQQGSRRSSVRVSYASSLSIAWPKSTEEDGKAVIRLLKE